MFVDALINLYTNDIGAGIRFYRDLLGLEETFRTPREGSPAHIEFRVGGFTLALSTVAAAKSEHRVDATPGAPAMAVVLWTDNVDETYARLTAAGVPSVVPPRDKGGNRNALLK